jgi:hypothetical protein
MPKRFMFKELPIFDFLVCGSQTRKMIFEIKYLRKVVAKFDNSLGAKPEDPYGFGCKITTLMKKSHVTILLGKFFYEKKQVITFDNWVF